jgi:hypothetical protein
VEPCVELCEILVAAKSGAGALPTLYIGNP